ncbi:MAG TPA: hypothetical protein VFQ44_02960 [Streptosporangiaceae bacterium]|nr:hypothetical protein [Streptosporangiaceae bacterium]
MIERILRGAGAGATAGAAGTTALNAVTYLDMTLRGRESSGAPASTVERVAAKANVDIPGEESARSNRLSGAGALSGIVTGLTVGAVYGATRAAGLRLPLPAAALVTAAAAMLAADGPMALLKVSDPRSWGWQDWAGDVIPHAAYGLVTATCADALDGQPGEAT